MSKTTGGPAFPVNHDPRNGWPIGMTIRDYFAAAALQGYSHSMYLPVEAVAAAAYEMADAMLAQRTKE